MNNKRIQSLRACYFTFIVFSFLSFTRIENCRAQCTPAAASAGCAGTHLTSNSTFSGERYLDGSETLGGTTTYKGVTFKTYTQSFSGETLHVCGNANIEFTQSTLGVIIIESGASVLLSGVSLSSATITNYGLINLKPNTGTQYAINNSGNIINKGIVDANNYDLKVTGKFNNLGLAIKINNVTFNSSSSSICVAANSILSANTFDNSSSNNGVTTNADGPGCIVTATTISGNKCLTSDATANVNLKFCYGSSTTLGNSACTNNGFSNAMNGVCTAGTSNCAYPLPITLLDFKAFKAESDVLVKWEIVNQIDSDHFEIFKSANGIDWHLMGSVPAVSDHNGVITYSLLDNEPTTGIIYYKLIEVDDNGKRTEYSITSFKWAADQEIDFFISPNPSIAEIHVNVVGPYPQYQMELIDLSGKVLSKTIVKQGQNTLDKVCTEASMYFLRLKADSHYITKKVIVQ